MRARSPGASPRNPPPRARVVQGYAIPVVDLSTETKRHVIVDREESQYLGHPTTALMGDGKTIFVVYPKGQASGAVVLKRSDDGGLYWSERLPVPIFVSPAGRAYNHHHQILFDRGRLYASWSNGIAHEDNPGQRMVFAVSDDNGRTWSAPRQITPQSPDPTSTFTAMGLRTHRDLLIAYYGHYAHNPIGFDQNGIVSGKAILANRANANVWVRKNSYCDLRISRDRGESWEKPIRVLDRFVPNLRPFPLRNGRLLMPGNVSFGWTDDPAGVTRWKRSGLPRLPKWQVDDPEGFLKSCSYRKDPRDYCEGSFFQTDDGTIHMMLRTLPAAGERHNGRLAVTESRDGGKTWSEPILTGYSDCSCRFHFGRLPDGRLFDLSCPDPKGARTPMVLALSGDGVAFERHFVLGNAPAAKPRLSGHAKGGAYGYPQYPVGVGAGVRLQKRFTHGLTLINNFIWSQTIERSVYLNDSDTMPEKRVSADSRPLREVLAMT
jgi:hypothetical protein